jgi:hypothetical protein
MRVLDIAITENAELTPVVGCPSPLITVDTCRDRLGRTTVLDLADARVVRGCAPSTACAT